MDAVTSSSGSSLGDLAASARRHRWLLLGTTVLGLAIAGAYLAIAPREYISVTSVLVQPTGAEESSVTGQRSNTEINLDTEAQLITSTDIAVMAADNLHRDDPVELAENVRATVPANTSILEVSFVANEAEQARDGARAFAAAYLTHRTKSAETRLSDQVGSAETDLSRLHGERADLVEELNGMDESNPAFAEIKKQRDQLDSEIAELSSNRGRWRSAAESVGSGRIISAARTPTSPASPNTATVLAAGGLLGLVAGTGVIGFRRRFAAKLWVPADLPRRCGVDLLAAVPDTANSSTEQVYGSFGPQGRMFGQIRNEVAASLDKTSGVIVVAGVAAGSVSSVVAANLAVAMVRAGDAATVVSTHATGATTVTSQLDAAAVPGLSDVLADRHELPAAVHRAARYPNLAVMGPGACSTVNGPSRELMLEVYSTLLETSSYVLVDAAPMVLSSQAQLLAADADAVVLAVECGHDTAAEVAEAANAVRRVGARLLGAVVLPKSTGPRVSTIEIPSTEADTAAESDSEDDNRDPNPAPPQRLSDHKADDTPTETLPRIKDDPVPAAGVAGNDEN